MEAKIQRSFMSNNLKKEYQNWYNDKLQRLQTSLTNKI